MSSIHNPAEGGGRLLKIRRAERATRRAVQPPIRELHLDEAGQGGPRQRLRDLPQSQDLRPRRASLRLHREIADCISQFLLSII